MGAFRAGRFGGLFPRARGAGCRTAQRIAHVAMINGDPAVAPMLRLRAFAQVFGDVSRHLTSTLSQGVMLRLISGRRQAETRTSPQAMLSPADPPCRLFVASLEPPPMGS